MMRCLSIPSLLAIAALSASCATKPPEVTAAAPAPAPKKEEPAPVTPPPAPVAVGHRGGMLDGTERELQNLPGEKEFQSPTSGDSMANNPTIRATPPPVEAPKSPQ